MKTYEVVIKIKVRAENEEDAKRQAFEILNSEQVMYVHVDVKECWRCRK